MRRYAYRPSREREAKQLKDPRLIAMREKLRTKEGRRNYARRAATLETVFGIFKAPLGFRKFLLRGLNDVRLERELVCLAYNMKRLCALKTA